MVDTVRDIRTRFIGQNMMGTAARGARRDVRSIGDEYSSLRNKISTVNQLIGGITLGIGGSSAARTLSNLQNNVARLSTLTTTLAKDQQFLSASSRNLSVDIESATSAFTRFKVLQNEGVINAGDSEKLILGLGNAYARFGTSVGSQENVIYGLAQALGQADLQAQELNQVVEPMPGILSAIGRAAGMTGGEFRQLTKDGEITSQMFLQSFLGALSTFDGSAAALAGNIQQTLTRLSNSYKETLLDLNEPITAGVASVAGALTTALEAVGDNAELTAMAMKTVGAAILVAYGTRGLRAVQTFGNKYKDAALDQLKYQRKLEAAHQQNATETIAANDRIKASNLSVVKAQARSTLGSADTARDAALRASAKKQEAVAEQAKTAAAKLGTLERKKAVDATLAATAAEKAYAAEQLKTQVNFTKYHAESAKSVQLRTAASAQLSTIQKALTKSEKEAVAASTALTRSREAVAVAEKKYGAASKTALALQEKEIASAKALQIANRNRFNAYQRLDGIQRASNIATANATASTLAAANATKVLTGALTLQSVASRTAAASLSALKGAYAFIGGGAGVAFAAALGAYALYKNLNQQTDASKSARERLAELGSEMSTFEEKTQAASEKLSLFEQLQRQVAAGDKAAANLDTQDGTSLREGSLRRILSIEELIANNRRKSQGETAKAQLEELNRLEYIAGLDAETAAINKAADKQARRAATERKTALNDAKSLAEKYEGVAGKAQKIRDAIVSMKNALKEAGDDKSLTAMFEQGIAGAQKELASVLGTNKAREQQIKLVDDLRKKLADVSKSYDTEAEKIGRSFADKEITIRLNFETRDPETDKTLITQATRDKLLVQNADAREAAITELMKEQSDKRTQDYEDALKTRQQADDKAFNDAVTKASALADARGRSGDVKGAQDQLLKIEQERLQRSFGLGETYRVLEKDARMQSERTIQSELARIEDEAYQARLKARNADSIDKGAGIFTKFSEAAQTDVRQYITLLDNMTDAEKARATESNRIGKREFEKNKVYRKASALVDTFAGANRALAQGGIWGVGEAAAIVALGLRNVANINKQQYGSASSGGTGGSSSSGSSSSSGTDSGVNNTTAAPQSSNVFIVGLPGETADQTMSRYNDFLPQLAQAARTRNVTISSERLSVSDTALLRVG